jgi:hypothetical protein
MERREDYLDNTAVTFLPGQGNAGAQFNYGVVLAHDEGPRVQKVLSSNV